MKNTNVKQETGLTTQNEPIAPVATTNRYELVPGFTPFSMMRRFSDDMERFFENFNGLALMPAFETAFDLPKMKKFQKTMWSPKIEITETNDQLMVRADLPGLRKRDIEVEFADGALVISGERNQESNKEAEGYFRTELNYGSFYRSIPLPEGFNAEKANASFADGVLEVTIPVPKKESNTRKLSISDKTEKAHAKTA